MDIGKLTPAEVAAKIRDRYREAVEATQIHEMRTMLSNVIYCTIRDMVYQLNGFDLPEDFDKHADRKAERALDQMLRTCPPEAWSKLAAPVMSKETAMREREHMLKMLADLEAYKLPDSIFQLAGLADNELSGKSLKAAANRPTPPAPPPAQDKQP